MIWNEFSHLFNVTGLQVSNFFILLISRREILLKKDFQVNFDDIL